jgi:hypothetical protein
MLRFVVGARFIREEMRRIRVAKHLGRGTPSEIVEHACVDPGVFLTHVYLNRNFGRSTLRPHRGEFRRGKPVERCTTVPRRNGKIKNTQNADDSPSIRSHAPTQ